MASGTDDDDAMSRSSSLSTLNGAEPVTKKTKDTMTIREVIAFCCPAGKQHSATTNRLYLLAENGPLWDLHSYLSCICGKCQTEICKRRKTDDLCKSFFAGEIYPGAQLIEAFGDFLCSKCKKYLKESLHLRAGYKQKTIVNALQINQMARQIEQDDILNAYHRNNDGSTLEEQNQFLNLIKQEKSVKDCIRNLTKDEIAAVFKDYAKGPNKLDYPMSYYDARKAILKHRQKRVYLLGLMYGEPKKNKKKAPHPVPVPYAFREGEIPGDLKLSREMLERYGREEDARLNHAHLCEVADLKNQTVIGVSLNPRVVRNNNRVTSTWENNF
jgi:hypothetical protein